jgi:hypothetical protein
VVALEKERARQVEAGVWFETGYVPCTGSGLPLDAADERRSFRAVCGKAGLEGSWTPRQLRPSFVSLMSDAGFRWRPSPGWSATAAPRSLRRSTASS